MSDSMGDIIPLAGVLEKQGVIMAYHVPIHQVDNGDPRTWRYIRDSLLELAAEISERALNEKLIWIAQPAE